MLRSSPPLSCSTTVPESPETEPPTENRWLSAFSEPWSPLEHAPSRLASAIVAARLVDGKDFRIAEAMSASSPARMRRAVRPGQASLLEHLVPGSRVRVVYHPRAERPHGHIDVHVPDHAVLVRQSQAERV